MSSSAPDLLDLLADRFDPFEVALEDLDDVDLWRWLSELPRRDVDLEDFLESLEVDAVFFFGWRPGGELERPRREVVVLRSAEAERV